MNNPFIGKRGKDKNEPPTLTVSGSPIPDGADTVNLGGDYYARLDLPHHPDTAQLVAKLREFVAENMKAKKRKAKADDETDI